MSNLKKSSLLILFAMIILVLIPMSFAADVDDAVATDADDAVAVAADDSVVADDVDVLADSESDDLVAVSPPSGLDAGFWVELDSKSGTIDEGCSTDITGTIYYFPGGGSPVSPADMGESSPASLTYSYTDANGDTQSDNFATNDGDFKFKLSTSSLLGNLAGGSSYLIQISWPGTHGYATETCLPATYNLTVNAVAPPIKTGNATELQSIIDATETGGVADISVFDVYELEGNTINVTKDGITIKGNGNTIINGYGNGKGLINIMSKLVTVTGIYFNDTNPNNNIKYGGKVNGWGVRFAGDDGASNGTVDACSFNNFNQAVVIESSDYNTVKNSNFTGGIATLLVNDPSVNKEQGSKVISVGGSFYTTIEGCIFDGPVLDAISIAKASGDAIIKNNQFINNAYSIFFGGASTDGTFILNNTFTNCGIFKDSEHDYAGFPVISIEKAASGVYIDGNTFYVVNDNMLIKGEQGNTAHGAPSTLGDINVTNNVVIPIDSTNFVGSSVTLFHINCKNSVLNPYAAVYVTGNNLTKGVKALVVWSTEWGTEDAYDKKTGEDISDVIVPKADLIKTQFTDIVVAQNGTITGKLVDITGSAVNAAEILCTIGTANQTVTTDKTGAFTIDATPGNAVAFYYAAGDKYDASEFSTTLPEVPAEDIVSKIAVANIKVLAGDNGQLKITLKDADGNVIDGKTVSVIIDGSAKNVAVKNGVATVAVKYASAGTHYVSAYFAADGYTSSIANAKITVNKKATTLTAAKATLKVKKAKKIKVTLKSSGKVVAGKKVTITVNGKTFSAKTNSKGVATISVKVAKKGSHTAVIKFAGDGAYKAVTKKVKYTVKK